MDVKIIMTVLKIVKNQKFLGCSMFSQTQSQNKIWA